MDDEQRERIDATLEAAASEMADSGVNEGGRSPGDPAWWQGEEAAGHEAMALMGRLQRKGRR